MPAQQPSNLIPPEPAGSAAGPIAPPYSQRAPARGGKDEGADVSAALERAQDRVRDLVAERPWAMVGAAAGVGLLLGAASRSQASSHLTRMVSGQAGGMAVRYALDTLGHWFERARSQS